MLCREFIKQQIKERKIPVPKLQVAVKEEQDRIEAVAKSQVDQRTAKALVDVLVGQGRSHSRTSEKVDQQDRTY